MKARVLVGAVVLGLVLAACGGEASTCEEVADETVALMQRIIDDVEADVGDMEVADFLESGASLPSSDSFSEESQKLNDRATELGCTPTDLDALIAERMDTLTSETPVGKFIKEAIQADE
jgi:hypothetical protein